MARARAASRRMRPSGRRGRQRRRAGDSTRPCSSKTRRRAVSLPASPGRRGPPPRRLGTPTARGFHDRQG
eukprot:5889094-Pyramimonas_sp.AAC.1